MVAMEIFDFWDGAEIKIHYEDISSTDEVLSGPVDMTDKKDSCLSLIKYTLYMTYYYRKHHSPRKQKIE